MSIFKSFLVNLFNKINIIVIGKRPNNTIFSFNFHNIRHINSFLRKHQSSLTRNNYVIIDVGAGQSPYYQFFEKFTEKYIAVDLESSLPKNEKREIQQMAGLAEDLPIEDNFADIVLSNQVLEHVLDERKAVKETLRVLKPGGIFIGSVPHISPVHLEPNDFRRFTDMGIKKLLGDAGFTNIFVQGNGGVFRSAALMINMDILMSVKKDNKKQEFKGVMAFLLFPIVGLINLLGLILDFISGDRRRTPSNICFIGYKNK
ncbi:MAG: class I SAM-dependent methyltransferase [Desulfobacterales bacterium]|nr:class I SAM-dependent methyltransferase [Desulfobacterales bacterium]